MNLRAQLNQKLNKNNKGSSLVTVLLVASIIAALVTVVLAIVILNVFMKRSDLLGQSAFYDAESALEEIRAGLAYEESEATTEAYLDTLSNYSNPKDGEKEEPSIYDDEDDDKVIDDKTKHFNKEFKDNLIDKLKKGYTSDNKGIIYDKAILENYLKETALNKDGVGAVVLPEGEQDLSTDNEHIMNVTAEGVELKNVHVRYTDKDNYVSEIKTDIVLEYPPINFQNATSIDNILSYGIIANKTFDPEGSVDVYGNAFLGSGIGRKINNNIFSGNIELGKANIINFNQNGTQETNVISGGDLILNNNGTINNNGVALWADSIALNDGSSYNMNSGSTYIKNDLKLGQNAKSTMAGKLIMFGNPWVAISEEMIQSDKVREWAKLDMPSYSSSILVLGSGAKLDLSRLNMMVLGGSAYIDSYYNDNNRSKYSSQRDPENDVRYSADMVMGQSIALKSDQRAYLVPPTLVGAGLNKGGNYSNGLANPMTQSTYNSLLTEIKNAKGYSSEGQVQPKDFVNMSLAEPTIGMSIYDFYKSRFMASEELYNAISDINLSEFDALQTADLINGTNSYEIALSQNDLKKHHDAYKAAAKAKNITKEIEGYLGEYMVYEYIVKRPNVVIRAQNTNNGPSLIYLFLQFNSVGENFVGQQNRTYIPAEAFYNEWYRTYNSTAVNKQRLKENLDYYLPAGDIGSGLLLPRDVRKEKTRMYYTGNLVVTDDNVDNIIVQDIITQPDFTIDLNVEYSKQSAYYQDAFYTLNRNLSTRYVTLTADDKKEVNGTDGGVEEGCYLFRNLIKTGSTSLDDEYTITDIGQKEFMSSNGEVAVVVDDGFTYDSTTENRIVSGLKSKYDNPPDNAKINVIIASGDVTVNDNFEGMIISGGKITIGGKCTKIESNPEKAAKALTARSADGTDFAAHYVKNAEKYILGGTGRKDDEDSGNITMKSFVTYRNWTRQ